MLTVVSWRGRPLPGYRSAYAPETVHVLRSMVARHYPDPHRFVCVTDDPEGLDGIETIPLWSDFSDLPHPHSHRHPSCYRRLKAFAPEMRAVLGERFVSVDLDCVILGDLRPLWNRPDPFVALAGSNDASTYNGSMFLMTAGARPQVWRDFNPEYSPFNAKKAGFYGSDQAWISLCLGPNEPRWTTADGVYSYRLHIAHVPGMPAPNDARIIFFAGKKDPWSPDLKGLPWIREHYQ